MLVRVPFTVVAAAVPPVRLAVPLVTVKACRLALAVRLPPLIVVVPPTMPVIVVLPPLRLAIPEILAALVTVPAAWPRLVAVPPVRLAVPVVTVRPWRLAFAVRFPPLIVVVPPTIPPLLIVVFPPERVAKSVILATLVTVPPDWVRFATVPPVRLAVPVEISTAPRVAFAVNVPAVIFDSPVTVAPFRLVMLLEAIEANVPPVAFRLPALVVAPIVPAEILAVPAAPTARLPSVRFERRVPPVTFARFVTLPPLKLLVPNVVFKAVKVPPVRFRMPAELAVVIVPAEMFAVPADCTLRLPRLRLESRVPDVTFALPVNVPAERLDVLPFTIRPLSAPPL